mgnify:CR=1 FL=1
MKTILSTLLIIASTTAFAANAEKPGAPDAKMQEMMRAFQEAAAPGQPHKVLAGMAGEWTYTSKAWMSADGKAEESSGSSSMKMILGGRWLQHEIKGTTMGQAFEGIGLTGYNNVKKKYETIWLDTMSTGAMVGEGDYSPKTKILADKGEYSCPITSSKKNSYRGEWKITSKNKMTYSMYGTMPNETKEIKQMEINFTRK